MGPPVDSQMIWTATSSLATVALLIVTAVYAWITFHMLKAARSQIWENSRPRLLIAARTNQGGQFLLIHIENIGPSLARNLRLKFDRPVHQQFGQNEDIGEAPLFATGVRAFPPHSPSRFGLGVAFRYLDENVDRTKHPLNFCVHASYEHEGKLIEEDFPLDLNEQYQRSTVERDYLEDFSKKFPDEFSRAARNITSAISKISAPQPREPIRRRSWALWFRSKADSPLY